MSAVTTKGAALAAGSREASRRFAMVPAGGRAGPGEYTTLVTPTLAAGSGEALLGSAILSAGESAGESVGAGECTTPATSTFMLSEPLLTTLLRPGGKLTLADCRLGFSMSSV